MVSRCVRLVVLCTGLALVYAAVVGILIALIPMPHGATDNLVMGACATLVCLLILFGIFRPKSYRT